MEKETSSDTTTVAGPTPAPAIDERLARLVEDASIEGLNGGIILFLRKRGLGEPGDKKSQKFAQVITAEFAMDEKEKSLYPLKSSIAQVVRQALGMSMDTFDALWRAGEHENLRKVVRLIVSGEMLNIMQEELEMVMKTYNEL